MQHSKESIYSRCILNTQIYKFFFFWRGKGGTGGGGGGGGGEMEPSPEATAMIKDTKALTYTHILPS